MQKSVFVFLFFLNVAFGNASTTLQDTVPPKVEKKIQYDKTENLNPPIFSKETIENYKKEKAFDYSEKPVTEIGGRSSKIGFGNFG